MQKGYSCGKKAAQGIKRTIFPAPVQSTRKRRGWGIDAQVQLRQHGSSPGAAAGTCAEGLKPPLGCSLPPQSHFMGVLRARICQVFHCSELLFGRGQRRGTEGRPQPCAGGEVALPRQLGLPGDAPGQAIPVQPQPFRALLHKVATE